MSDRDLYQLAARVGQALRAAGWRLASAESCTAGWIAKALTDVPGSSQWFECGYVTYSNAAKQRDLGVSARTLVEHGAVSEATVKQMAAGASRICGAEVAVAVSGIAGPEGGTRDRRTGPEGGILREVQQSFRRRCGKTSINIRAPTRSVETSRIF